MSISLFFPFASVGKLFFNLVRVLWSRLSAFFLWEMRFMFGGICRLFGRRVSRKRHWVWGQLLSVDPEEGFSSAWIRLMYQSLSSPGFLRNLPWLAEQEESSCDSSIKKEDNKDNLIGSQSMKIFVWNKFSTSHKVFIDATFQILRILLSSPTLLCSWFLLSLPGVCVWGGSTFRTFFCVYFKPLAELFKWLIFLFHCLVFFSYGI